MSKKIHKQLNNFLGTGKPAPICYLNPCGDWEGTDIDSEVTCKICLKIMHKKIPKTHES